MVGLCPKVHTIQIPSTEEAAENPVGKEARMSAAQPLQTSRKARRGRGRAVLPLRMALAGGGGEWGGGSISGREEAALAWGRRPASALCSASPFHASANLFYSLTFISPLKNKINLHSIH